MYFPESIFIKSRVEEENEIGDVNDMKNRIEVVSVKTEGRDERKVASFGGTISGFSSVLLIRYWDGRRVSCVYKQAHTCAVHDDSWWTVISNV